jgi:hypothetical protein
MPDLQATVLAPFDEIVESMEMAPRNGFHREPRCYVCRDDEVCKKVNDLLASGASYAMTLRALGDDAVGVTSDSIRRHAKRHFPVQDVGKATYREILERRAQESRVDFVDGVATAITPMAILESIMVKGYQTLVDPDTKIDVNTTMKAAVRLHELTGRDAGQLKMIDLRQRMDRIVQAAQMFIPESEWEEFLGMVEGRPAPARTIEAPAPGVREFTPTTIVDEDEDDI